MAIMDSTTGEQDVMRIWSLLTEVSEQLSQNRTQSVSLHNLASGIKTQAVHSQTGFVLRRFNLDMPKEIYEAELERMNAAMSAENQTLQNDNRQLNGLIREYEQTLESVMSSFRTRAYEVQQHELALMRDYESAIAQRETEALDAALSSSNARSESLARIGRLLRAVMRKLGGEDVQVCEELMHDEDSLEVSQPVPPIWSPSIGRSGSPEEVTDQDPHSETHLGGDQEDDYVELARELDEEDEPDKLQRRLAAADFALERESELARLERENEELRNLLKGVLNAETAPLVPRHYPEVSGDDRHEEGRTSPASSSVNLTLSHAPRQLGGPTGTVGPFGTYKKRAAS